MSKTTKVDSKDSWRNKQAIHCGCGMVIYGKEAWEEHESYHLSSGEYLINTTRGFYMRRKL